VPPREALAASAFGTLCTTVAIEAVFRLIRRLGERKARHWFSIAINPERFVEPLTADAGASAGELDGGESTSGLEPSRAESRSRGAEATEVGGHHMAFSAHRIARRLVVSRATSNGR